MIIIAVNGGLGNQLQQYALYEKFRSLGIPAKLDLSWFTQKHELAVKREMELNRFPNIDYVTCSKIERERLLCNQNIFLKILYKVFGTKKYFPESAMFHPEIFLYRNMYLEGYWACEAYYADIIGILQKKLVFPESDNQKNSAIVKQMKEQPSASIHIRRGDYLRPENNMFADICTDKYYQTAIAYIKQKDLQTHFYIFSDDPDYAAYHYKGDEYTIVDWNKEEKSFLDMYLMSQCRYNICANSTFSFWGARLNSSPDKIMIRPLKQKNTMVYEPEEMHKLWKNWILIDEKGKIV